MKRATFSRSFAARSQRGVSLVLILGILGLIGLAAWLLTNRGEGSASSIGDASSKAVASAVISQANALQGGFQLAALNGVSPATVTLDNTSTTGIFHPKVGGLEPLQGLGRAFADGTAGNWEVVQFVFPGAGTDAADTVVLLDRTRGVRLDVCDAISRTFVPPAEVLPVLDATAFTTFPGDAATYATMGNRPFGCARTADNRYIPYALVASR